LLDWLIGQGFAVPDDLWESVIDLTKTFLYHVEQVRTNTTQEDKISSSYYSLIQNMRMKLVFYLTTNAINRPTEALLLVEAQALEHKQYLKLTKSRYEDTPWIENITLYPRYGDMLILNNKFDTRTRVLLEHILESTNNSYNSNTPNIVTYASLAHVHLALLLQLTGEPNGAQKRHLDHAVKYFRKNRTGTKTIADLFLQRPNQPIHPVYVALGEG